ncbi:glutathione S-transferase family protein [Rhizobium sp. KVB221]|uniref:Glutathione S-transferase family protein n=1 Tax=Rhizobium setariae TaxID=2801340 RepID=A0A936YM41_9HYPH|nr:glutathione S-transferase family protein [Rhizobium setariae]MBL0371252.1 glutathione S-transferase family protein [Rhizobium setariae]
MTRLLYSLCGADADCRFSPHVWKVAMALSHKRLDFQEVPTPFTSIRSVEIGFSPTVPVINDNGELVRESFDIALYLEERYPERPSLFGGEGGKALSRAIEGYSQFILHPALAKILIMDIHDLLAPADQTYFRSSREARFGKTLEDVAAAADEELAGFSSKLEPLRHALKFQPWLGGDGPLFADYIVFGALQWARVASPKSLLAAGDPVHDWFERCLDLHDGQGRAAKAA